jgi:hypothetical protein
MVAVVALGAMLVSCCLPQSTYRALELYKQSLARQGQAAQHSSSAARERVPFSSASAVVVQLWICILTLLELDMLSAADPKPLTSLQTAEQQQHMSAHCMSHTMLTHSVHVAVRCGP